MYQSEIFDDFLYLLALEFFRKAGHAVSSEVLFANHTPEQVVYFDSDIDIYLSRIQRDMLKEVTNISHLFDIYDDTFEISGTGSVSFYSIELLSTKRNRSQVAYDIHSLLRMAFSGIGSIVLYRFDDELMLSAQVGDSDIFLSDWFHQDTDFELWIERINVYGMSLKSATDFVNDFIYNSARCYFIYPITIETAVYTMLPVNYFSNLNLVGEDFDIEDFKIKIREYLRYTEIKYGYDYVEQGEMETLSINTGSDLELIAFELELDNESTENDEEDGTLVERDNSFDFHYDGNVIEEYEFSGIDEDVPQDPIAMLKHIKKTY